MSVGNLNTYGDKKNNFTWQLSMLQQLKLIEDAVIASGITPVARTASILRDTGAGSTSSSAKSVSIYNAGPLDGVVLTDVIRPGESLTWDAGLNNTLGAITYDATGTELVITTVV